MRHITDDERRARLARRHGLAAPVADTLAAARSVVCLHATEPASVHLAAWARCGATRDEVDAALYDDRSVVKQLAMRRTVFAFPRELLPAVWGSASRRVAGQQRTLISKDVERHDVTDDGVAWLERARAAVLARLDGGAELSAKQLREELPELSGRTKERPGTSYLADLPFAPRVLTYLGARAEIMRGRNAGHWRISRPLWTLTSTWLGHDADLCPEREGYAALVRAWLRSFGPGTEADLVWWLGATKSAVRRALADADAVEVSLDRGGTGWVLPDDLDPVPDPGPWAALLPALDPTTMGWKGRGFHLGEHADRIFDRNGNGGPTAWWNGRIVGGWYQREDGQVVVVPAECLPPGAGRALDAKAEELSAWLYGEVVRSIYQSPLARAHLGSA